MLLHYENPLSVLLTMDLARRLARAAEIALGFILFQGHQNQAAFLRDFRRLGTVFFALFTPFSASCRLCCNTETRSMTLLDAFLIGSLTVGVLPPDSIFCSINCSNLCLYSSLYLSGSHFPVI